jgi:two-component system response regulator GlrR
MPAGSSKLWIAVLAEPALETVRFLSWIKNHRGRTLVLTVVPAACLEYVLNHASSCLDEFVVEPATEAEFSHRVLKVLQPGLELERIASRVIAQLGSASLVGNSPKLLAVVEKLPKLACSEMQVLITGETGTGKELYARALHLLGPRRNLPFVTADCSVIPDHLFESEMFGHARGAFTDAHAERRGLAAVAAGGTLFLDEIDSLSTTAQAKLLRFVQEKTYRPLGGDRECKADVQVIAASNVDLSARVASQRFRGDLYFRLDVLHVHIPPLRDRLSDLPALAYHFLEKLPSPALREKRISSGALDYLASYQWPGNVRELSNVIQRAAVLSDGNTIHRSDIALGVPDASDRESAASFSECRTRAIADFERAFVQRALEEHRGNVTHAAQATGKDRRVFGRLIKKYDIRWSADSVGPCGPTGGTIRFQRS